MELLHGQAAFPTQEKELLGSGVVYCFLVFVCFFKTLEHKVLQGVQASGTNSSFITDILVD